MILSSVADLTVIDPHRARTIAESESHSRHPLIPTVIDQNPCAHLLPRDMIFHGWRRLFQAWQHSATMSS